MARTVDVTLVPETLEVEAGGGAKQVVFTATYRQPGNFEVMVRPISDQAEASGWIRLEGPAERTFQENATVQLVVQIDAPQTAAGGDYGFRLAVVGVENTDEDYTESPLLTVAVRERSAPEPKPFPWPWLAAAAGLLVTLGLTAYLMSRPSAVALMGDCSQLECAQGLQCTGGTCLGALAYAGCALDTDCASGFCQAGVCAERPGPAVLGEPCQAQPGCTEGLSCRAGRCKGGLGYVGCSASEDCVSGVCDAERCTSLGMACTSDATCDKAWDQCARLSGGERLCLRKVGQPCGNSRECSSDHCDGKSKACATRKGCQKNAHCGTGQICSNEVCYLQAGARCDPRQGLSCEFAMCSVPRRGLPQSVVRPLMGRCPTARCTKTSGCVPPYQCVAATGRCAIPKAQVKSYLLHDRAAAVKATRALDPVVTGAARVRDAARLKGRPALR